MKIALRALAACVGLALMALVWGFFIEPSLLFFRDQKIVVKNWPQRLNGFTVAFITDPHVGSPHIDLEKLAEIVAQTNARKPDLVLLGGDYVIQGVLGGKRVPSDKIAQALAGLKAPYGVYGILGNHDWWDDSQRILAEFTQAGIPLLEDRSVEIRHPNGDSFWLAGITDYLEGPHDVAKALSGIPDGVPLLALTHTPDIFPELPHHIGLTLAGHTHGGQVYLPFIGRPLVPSQYGERYAKGLVTEQGRHLFVSVGIGTSILPVRFLTPPEVVMLRLYGEN